MRLGSFGANTIDIDTCTCVESSVREAFNKGYDVIIFKDCVASKGPGYLEPAPGRIAESYEWVLTADVLVKKIYARELTLTGLTGEPFAGAASSGGEGL